MRIREIRVQNFRSILDETLYCDDLTVLVGRNGAGKSTFLNALQLFYDGSPQVTEDDFHNRDLSKNIEIEVIFTDLNDDAKLRFANYVENDAVNVVRVFSGHQLNRSGTYHGLTQQNSDFVPVRNAGGAMDIRRAYAELRTRDEYASLPQVTSQNAALEALAQWEVDNPSRLQRTRETDQFFGFTGVGQGYLGRYTKFILIPAVRDAIEDANEGRGSSVTEIMDLVVRNVLAEKREFVQFQQRMIDEYRQITDRTNLPELDELQIELANMLHTYVPSADVILDWIETENIQLPLPRARVMLSEDGFDATVDKTGHGLQRAFIFTMLQQLAIATTSPMIETTDETQSDEMEISTSEPLPNLVLAIEEPELYQHPSRQRHLSSVLMRLATGATPGVANSTQVLYSTHSPLFVGLDRADNIRVVHKSEEYDNQPKVTSLKSVTLTSIVESLKNLHDDHHNMFTIDSLRSRLHTIMTPWMNEGFFADVVVLVEGEDDRAAILGTALSMGLEVDSMGIAVIPCFGKTNLDKPAIVFSSLDIPLYVIWDGDKGSQDSKIEFNRALTQLLIGDPCDQPSFIANTGACFEIDLETSLKTDIGDDIFDQLLVEARSNFGIAKKRDAMKNPIVIQYIVTRAAEIEKPPVTIQTIINMIIELQSN